MRKTWLCFGAVLFFYTCLPAALASAYYYGTAWDESIFNPGDSSHGQPTDAPYLDQEYAAGMRLRNVYVPAFDQRLHLPEEKC